MATRDLRLVLHEDHELAELPRDAQPDLYAFQFILLLRVRVNSTETLLMKPSIARWPGYSVFSTWVTVEGGRLNHDTFLEHKQRLGAILAAAAARDDDSWEKDVDRWFGDNFPDRPYSVRSLYRLVLQNIGRSDNAAADGKGKAVEIRPFPADASLLYLCPDDAHEKLVMNAVYFLRLSLPADDQSVLEFRNLEFVPVEFFYPDVDLHPRYELHKAMRGFFEKFGTRFAPGAEGGVTSLVDQVPLIEWRPAKTELSALTFAADFSYYYEHADDPDLVLEAFYPPNPGSRDEVFFRRLLDLVKSGVHPRDFRRLFIPLFDNYVTMALFRTGMFFRAFSNGFFYGMTETELLRRDEDTVRAFPYHVLVGMTRFLKMARVLVDHKRIETVGSPFDDPERWFNMRTDVVPFDLTDELRRLEFLFENAPIPITHRDRALGYKKRALILSESAAEFLCVHRFVHDEAGLVGEALRPNEVYDVSRDDSLLGFVPGDEGRPGPGGHFFIWRMS